jgi:hypothetical protein
MVKPSASYIVIQCYFTHLLLSCRCFRVVFNLMI